MASKSRTKVTPSRISVNGKNYKVVKVGREQRAGQGDWAAGGDFLDTFRGERILVLKPE